MKPWGYQRIISLLLLSIELTLCARKPSSSVYGPTKEYTGFRVSEDSRMVVNYHEQTIAVLELAKDGEMLSCEQLEVKTSDDRKATLNLLKSLKIKKQKSIPFEDMLDLQERCSELDTPAPYKPKPAGASSKQQSGLFSGLSGLFSGIYPGTKWCGKGNLAANYYTLGSESVADKCCRTHDFCPVKVSGMSTQYDITNTSSKTRTHCACDKRFYKCLKRAKRSLTDLIGELYFDIHDPKCVDESEDDEFFLRQNKLRYGD